MSIFDDIAKRDGSAYTKWGPCYCDTDPHSGDIRECPACENANRIDCLGLDWDEEYEKARLRNFAIHSNES